MKTIVFDLGNVVIDFHPTEYLTKLGFNDEEVSDLIEIIFNNQRWNKLDRGEIQFEDYIILLKSEFPFYAESINRIFADDWVGKLSPVKGETVKLINELYNYGYKLYILSNISKPFLDDLQRFDFLKCFSGGTFSYQVNRCKPEPEIYNIFLTDNGLNAKDCFFIDDRKENIESAKLQGIDGLVFTDEKIEIIRDMFLN